MKEIKVRAWQIEDKFMFIPRRIDFPHFMIGDTAKWIVWYQFEDFDDSTPEHFPLEDISFSGDELEIMQYTGLHDKNGKEIYEGDVVRYKNEDAEYREYKGIGLIQTDSHSHCVNGFACRDIKTKYYVRLICGHALFSIEAIGNIYENPELVQKIDSDQKILS